MQWHLIHCKWLLHSFSCCVFVILFLKQLQLHEHYRKYMPEICGSWINKHLNMHDIRVSQKYAYLLHDTIKKHNFNIQLNKYMSYLECLLTSLWNKNIYISLSSGVMLDWLSGYKIKLNLEVGCMQAFLVVSNNLDSTYPETAW